MSVIRVVHDARYTVMSNGPINDEALSFKALGLLTYLLSKPDGWAVRAEDLARRSPREGMHAVRTGLKELETAGYLVRRRVQDSRGQWSWEQAVYEHPVDPEERSATPSRDNRDSEPTEVRLSDVGKPHFFVSTEEQVLTPPTPPASQEVVVDMEAWGWVDRLVDDWLGATDMAPPIAPKTLKTRVRRLVQSYEATEAEVAVVLDDAQSYTESALWGRLKAVRDRERLNAARAAERAQERRERTGEAIGLRREYDRPAGPLCASCDGSGWIEQEDLSVVRCDHRVAAG